MRVFRYLLAFAGCCLTAPIPTRAPRPGFLGVPNSPTPIAGHFNLRIGVKPPARLLPFLPAAPVSTTKTRVTVYLDGSLFLSDAAPLTYDWDTNAVRSGRHTLLLRWVDPTNHNEQTLEKITVLVANASRPVAPPAPVAPVEAHDTVAAPADSPLDAAEPSVADPAAVASAPGRRVLATLHPQESSLVLTPNLHPLDAHATALNLVGDRLCIGLPDGGLTLYDCKRHRGRSLRLPQPTGKVVAIQSDAEAITWLTDPTSAPAPAESDNSDKSDSSDTHQDTAPPPALRQLCIYRFADRKLTIFYLAEANAFASTARVVPWQSGVALFAAGANGFLDPKTGEIVDLESQFPLEATDSMSRFSALYLASEGADGLLVRAETHLDDGPGASGNISHLRLALWRRHANAWTPVGVFLSPATDTWRLVPLAVTPQGVCSVENRSGLHVGLIGEQGQAQAVPLPFREYFKTQNAQVALGEKHLWTTDGAVLYHTDLEKTLSEAFLPWNEKGLRFQAFAPDKDGVWLATNRDVRRLSLTHPDPGHGYAGLIKFRLGTEAATPTQPKDQQLASAIAEWQGVPYKWGGSTKQGTDCSGFVMAVHQQLGVSLPRGTVELRNCAKGQLIHDELQYGDVLVYPGHCAIYIGDGKTAETVDKAVSYATVWYHDDVVVRRFLHASQTQTGGTQSKKRDGRSSG